MPTTPTHCFRISDEKWDALKDQCAKDKLKVAEALELFIDAYTSGFIDTGVLQQRLPSKAQLKELTSVIRAVVREELAALDKP